MLSKVFYPGDYLATEISHATFKLAVATGIVLDGTTATVTSANHLLATGDYTTFSAATGVTAINNATWGPVTKVSSSVYTFPCALTGSVTGSPIQEKLYFFSAGDWIIFADVNGNLEYNVDQLLGLNSSQGGIVKGNVTGPDVWRILKIGAAVGAGSTSFTSDGFSFRFRDMGTTATSYFSKVK